MSDTALEINSKKEKAFVYTHLGLGDMILTISAVRYLATKYDTVMVVCKSKYKETIEALYADNASIKFHIVTSDADMSSCDKKGDTYKTNGYDIYSCGACSLKRNTCIYAFPNSFYDDMGIPRSVRRKYFNVPRTDSAKRLYDDFKSRPYIVVHQNSSNMSIPIIQKLLDGGESRLIIDVNTNRVDKELDPEGYALAERCTNIPFTEYVNLFEGADELHMIDSSVYCFAMHLNLNSVKRRVVYIRDTSIIADSFGKFEIFESDM
jgi:ribonuclease BN (tRNA processing enzyme)